MADRVPLVDYLVLGGSDGDPPGGTEPHLVALECTSCQARFFDRRNACAACGALEFRSVDVARAGTLRAFTIVSMAAPGIEVPFVAGVIDCEGTTVRGNVVNTPADPEHVTLGMPLRLTTYSLGTDSTGTEAVGFGFEPVRTEGTANV